MNRSEKLAAEVRDQAVAIAGPSRAPIVDHYDVVIHR
jgi:hypothetical protein